jgi:hypothetical protein
MSLVWQLALEICKGLFIYHNLVIMETRYTQEVCDNKNKLGGVNAHCVSCDCCQAKCWHMGICSVLHTRAQVHSYLKKITVTSFLSKPCNIYIWLCFKTSAPIPYLYNFISSVSTVAKLWSWQRIMVWFLAGATDISPHCPDQRWTSTNLLPSRHQGLFLQE